MTLFGAAEGHLPYDNSNPLVVLSMIVNGEVPRHQQTGPVGEAIRVVIDLAPAYQATAGGGRQRGSAP
ncbi:hypothetical protein SAMN05216215_100342 [Saccharopolyspora shandongensis]|uniref:Uncharacterized protein n=1 Tax=Saccharopolyspora shandongensis TaxID=418495 RepID=A0A1H2TAM5_9PSEU|nr:hypothetical protein SAMN05216215_100342 [Saccharopolyspora shandongensis]